MLSEEIKQYTITNYLDEICGSLKSSDSRFLILTAETAAGKSTILPLALLQHFQGKIFMTEPRRLAVLGVANRVADLWQEKCGETVGYKIHLENKISAKTRLEVATEAILIRHLQEDPALEEYNVVVLDEFHERSVNTDLALAFLKEAVELRDDLFVIIMSATIDTEKLQNYLGNNTPVMKVPGRQFPVDIVYDNKNTVEQAVVNECLHGDDGDILVFLPGIKEIRRAEQELLGRLPADVEVLKLHSSISLEDQKRVITAHNDGKKRVILSSAIAETSLTVPGITTVIDSGLSRINRMNISTGMENLSTEIESEFSACQRSGRAGRTQAGKCIRLWAPGDKRIKDLPAEILRADLANLVLECAERGIYSAEKIQWLESPSIAAWTECKKLLEQLGLLKADGHITEKGKAALSLGIHPRLASIVLDTGNIKLVLKYSNYNQSSPEIQKRFVTNLEQRLERLSPLFLKNKEKMDFAMALLSGFPDRLAKRISEQGKVPVEYQFASGRKAVVYENTGKAGEWIVAPEVMAGTSEGTIFEFEPLAENFVNEWLQNRMEVRQECRFAAGKIQKEEQVCYGQIIIKSRKLAAEPGDLAAAWCGEVKIKGLECLPQSKQLESFISRAEFWQQEHHPGESLEQVLITKVNEWLPPFITGNSLTAEAVYNGIYWYLEGEKIDKEVPAEMRLPNGNKCKVKYEKLSSPEDKNKIIIRPVIEIIIQRIFGCFETPKICGIKVLLRLLSPASRPLQVTDDLENFWTGAWLEICKEMKGRYPKHNWDYKIAQKEDTK